MRYLLILLCFLVVQQEKATAQFKNTLEDFDYKKQKKKKVVEEPDYDEYILKNGFFLGGIFQSAFVQITNTATAFNSYNPILSSGAGLGFHLGNRWYFGRMRTYRPGFGAVWGRVNLILIRKVGLSTGGFIPHVAIAPANISFINAFSFGGKIGLEVNVNFGLNAIMDIERFDSAIGYLINPTIKFRYKSFAVGLDITIMSGNYNKYNELQYFATLIGLSIGGKF